MSEDKKLLIVAGGTGGHIFPSLTLYKECLERNIEPYLLSDSRISNYESKCSKIFNKYLLPIKSSSSKLLFLFSLIPSLYKTFSLIRSLKPDLIVSFGSYVSIPVMIVATLLQKKILLHESNAVLGKSLKIFFKKNNVLSSGFPVLYVNNKKISDDKFIYTGNPIEKSINFTPIKKKNGRINICVFGGSQGSNFIDNVISKAISEISYKKEHLKIIHQCRKENLINVKKNYDNNNIECIVQTFFKDINEIIKDKIHIVICRAGAQSITEITKIGRVAIYIPYPYSKDNHQLFNANSITKNKKYLSIIREDKNLKFHEIKKNINDVVNNFDILNEQIKNDEIFDNKENLIELVERIVKSK